MIPIGARLWRFAPSTIRWNIRHLAEATIPTQRLSSPMKDRIIWRAQAGYQQQEEVHLKVSKGKNFVFLSLNVM